MEKIIAHCGLVCSSCPTFIATKNDDDEARKKTAKLYSEKFGFNLTPQDINCDGCLSDSGNLIAYCRECKIRSCCREKQVDHCAVCVDQPCDHLKKFHDFSPDAKRCFDSLLKEIKAG